MAKTEFKLIRKPKSPNIQMRIIRAEVVKKLEPVAQRAVISRRKVVANWEDKPDFAYKISVKPEAIRLIVNLTRPKKLKSGRANTNDLWRWIDQTGTRPHPIPRQPKQKGALRFEWGGPGSYQAKTSARPARSGGPGRVVGGQTVYRKQVQHPGFEPRHFSDAINQDLLPKFRQAVDSGYRAGMRKAKKANG